MYSINNILIHIKTYLYKYGLKEFIWLILFFFILLPTSLVWSVQPGSEGSWHIGLNLALQKKLSFGKDYIFAYGPLGFLCTKLTIVVSKWVILIFELTTIGCSLYIIRYFFKQSKYHIICYILIIPLLLLFKLSQYFSGTDPLMDLIVPIFLFFLFYFLNWQNVFAIVLAAIVSVFEFYFKINYGIVLIIIFYAALLIALYKKIVTTTQVVILSLAHISIIFLLAYIFHVALIPYIISGLHLINSYNDAFSIVISIYDFRFIMAVLIIILYGIGFAISYKYYLTNSIALFCYLFGVIYLYLLFKNGFVRADDHIYTYFRDCTFIFGLIWVFEKESIKKIWAVLTCLVLVLYFIFYVRAGQNVISTRVQDYINFDYFKDIYNDVSYKNKLSDDCSHCRKIPQQYLYKIGHSTVDIIPSAISEIYYNNLNYDPRPVGGAYDEYLDQKNYEKYTSPTAPGYIIFSFGSIDNRYPFWDESITKQAMLSNYKLDDVDSFYILLKKRERPLKINFINEKRIKLELGKEYKIDSTSNLLYLYADVKYNLLGKIKRFLFQPPPLYVILTYNDGTSVSYQAILPIIKTGVLLNQKIETIGDAARFFDKPGFNTGKIIRFRFEAKYGFNPEIEALIKEAKIEQ